MYDEILKSVLFRISYELDLVMSYTHVDFKSYHNPFKYSSYQALICKFDSFEIIPYDYEDEDQKYNFKWKDVEISWYKYFPRGLECNKEMTLENINELLLDCLKSMENYEEDWKRKFTK